MMRTPCCSWNRSINARGTAEPPQTTRRSDESSSFVSSPWRSRSLQIVGTAAAIVGRSAAIMRASGAACR